MSVRVRRPFSLRDTRASAESRRFASVTLARIPFERLPGADLVVGAVYEGGIRGTSGDDPMSKLLPCGNRGGFRIRGSRKMHSYYLALLYTTGADPDWPDFYDDETGLLTYFGDNKRPGSELHATRPGGNELLRFSFEILHTPRGDRSRVPPFFVFRKAASGSGRDVEFIGLAVPGAADVDPTEEYRAADRTPAPNRAEQGIQRSHESRSEAPESRTPASGFGSGNGGRGKTAGRLGDSRT